MEYTDPLTSFFVQARQNLLAPLVAVVGNGEESEAESVSKGAPRKGVSQGEASGIVGLGEELVLNGASVTSSGVGHTVLDGQTGLLQGVLMVVVEAKAANGKKESGGTADDRASLDHARGAGLGHSEASLGLKGLGLHGQGLQAGELHGGEGSLDSGHGRK
eukprot:TRINITY_DN79480_c0_g1_i1.p1 TRINITY_DN79480_c0_g1~~TRINITY_DN79480_c0_g1_i1.p1  ORF type:complete len:161 (-),score=8.83 TRINITY_DN79480_c0_g1_i1:145-627(-)